MDNLELQITNVPHRGTFVSEGLPNFDAGGVIMFLTYIRTQKKTKIVSSHANMLYIHEPSFSLN